MGWLKTIHTVFHGSQSFSEAFFMSLHLTLHLGLHFFPHLTLHLISQSEPLLR